MGKQGGGALTLACRLSALESQTHHHGLLKGLKKLQGARSRCVISAIPTCEKQYGRQDLGRAMLTRNYPGTASIRTGLCSHRLVEHSPHARVHMPSVACWASILGYR